MIELVKKLRDDHPKMGGRKVHDLLKAEMAKKGIKMGRDALFELLAANGLLIRRRRRRVTTTFSGHRFRKYPNLISKLVVERPNLLWPGRRCGRGYNRLVHKLRVPLYFLCDRRLFETDHGL